MNCHDVFFRIKLPIFSLMLLVAGAMYYNTHWIMTQSVLLISSFASSLNVQAQSTGNVADLKWYAPNSTKVNSLTSVINGTGVYGFIFNSSTVPADTPYGTYNWCNMPHVRVQEYPKAHSSYKLEYVEVVRLILKASKKLHC